MFIEIFGCKVHYLVMGKNSSNPPIVFLHGWGGSTDSFMYFADKLSSYFCSILIDFPSFGLSTEPSVPLNIDNYSEIVEAVLLQCNVSSCYIVAHSFGGRVAINLCKRGVIRVDKMVLTASAGIKRQKIASKIKILKYKYLKFLSKIKLYKVEKLAKFGSIDYNKLSPLMKNTFLNIVNNDQTKDIKYITCPLLLFWGQRDKDTPFFFTKVFRKYAKQSEVVSTSGGHFAYIEYSNLFLECLKSFL